MTGLIGVMTAIVSIFIFFKTGALVAIDPLNTGKVEIYQYLFVPVVAVSIICLAYFASFGFKEYLKCGPSALGSTIGAAIVGQLLMVLNTVAIEFGITENQDPDDLFGPWVSALLLLIGGEVGMYLGIKYARAIHYISISFFSSYFIVRAFSIWFGGFTSEADLIIGLFTEDETPLMTWPYSIYCILILVLWTG
jgi:hypothetical protein